MSTVSITANTSWYLYNFRRNTILALLDKGMWVVAVAPQDEYSEKLEQLGCSYESVSMDRGGTNPVNDVRTFLSFMAIFRRVNPNIILNFTPKNNIYGTLAAKLYRIKVINNIAGLGMLFINESLSSKLARMLYKISQPTAHKIFFQNEDDRKLFLDARWAPKLLTDRLPGSGVDLQRFKPSPAPKDGVARFLVIARMLHDKGVGVYVDAARILKNKYGENVNFQLLGFLDVDNPSAVSQDQMDEWVAEGIVNYLGTSNCVEREIAKVDCMVLPSFYREGVPKSLLEAGAMAKPVVTTDNVGCREVVDDGVNGFLCEPRSVESLVEKLERIIRMPHEERLSMGEQSREKIAAEFDEQIVIQKYMDAVEECLEA